MLITSPIISLGLTALDYTLYFAGFLFIFPLMFWVIISFIRLGESLFGAKHRSVIRPGQLRYYAAYFLVVLVWFFVAIIVDIFTTPVYLIRDSSLDRLRLIGGGTPLYTLYNGERIELQQGMGSSIIINDSPQIARVERIVYSTLPDSLGGRPITTINAYTVTHVCDPIDYFGPGDPPPKSLERSKGQSYVIKRWLTW
jgi:hypothetical protein